MTIESMAERIRRIYGEREQEGLTPEEIEARRVADEEWAARHERERLERKAKAKPNEYDFYEERELYYRELSNGAIWPPPPEGGWRDGLWRIEKQMRDDDPDYGFPGALGGGGLGGRRLERVRQLVIDYLNALPTGVPSDLTSKAAMAFRYAMMGVDWRDAETGNTSKRRRDSAKYLMPAIYTLLGEGLPLEFFPLLEIGVKEHCESPLESWQNPDDLEHNTDYPRNMPEDLFELTARWRAWLETVSYAGWQAGSRRAKSWWIPE